MSTVPLLPIDVLNLYPPHGGTLAGLLGSRVRVVGAREFLVADGRSLSWSEFESEAKRAASALRERGVVHGDRVAIMSANCTEMVVLLFATARLGAIFVPVNPELGVEEARYVIGHCRAKLVFASAAAMATAKAASHVAPIAIDSPLRGEADVPEQGKPDDTCILIYTSGTTGFPKAVMHSQKSYVLCGEAFVERMHLQPDERMLCILPLFHINALFYSLGGALAAGATLILEPRFSASAFWRRAAETNATEANVLAAVGNILALRPREELVPHRLRKIYGSPVGPKLDRVFREEFGVPMILEGYGMSEIPGACSNPPEANRVGSMGRACLHPDHSMKFTELKVLEDGELAVRTPIVMQGYFRDPEQTRASFQDDWFLTGDLVRMDEDGYVWFIARKKDIIRRRGENVSGAELDRVIGEHPSVQEAAAIAVPSDLGEDDILVALVPRPGVTIDPQDIAAWCKAKLAPQKQPRYVVMVDSLPHTPSHRVAKFRLKEDCTLRSRAVEI